MSIYPDGYEITIYDNNISATRTLQISIPIIIEKNTGINAKRNFGMIVVEGYLR